MTVAPESPSVRFDDLGDAFRHLRAQGLRLSSARRLVVEALFAADGPASADAIAERLQRGAMPADLASVYRNLETLERAGIVRHVHLGHGPGLYALAGGREREYLHCERCGRVDPVPPDRMERIRTAIRQDFGYQARFTHFPIVGLCAGCAALSRDVVPHERAAPPHGRGDHDHGHGAHGRPHVHDSAVRKRKLHLRAPRT